MDSATSGDWAAYCGTDCACTEAESRPRGRSCPSPALEGASEGAALAIIGAPLPVLWGVLAFITKFIPNVGFLIGLIPPALLALLTLGWEEMLLVIAVYCVLNFVIQSLIQPRFVGDSVALAMTTTFVTLVFWAWLLGPLGALLAVPLALLLKAVLVDVDPTARWATALAGPPSRGPRSDNEPPKARTPQSPMCPLPLRPSPPRPGCPQPDGVAPVPSGGSR